MRKISVIVPVYNVELFLDACLKSIVSQTYRDLEIILVDDGSTDTSLFICQKYKEIDDRIKIISKENGGLSSARNFGLDFVTGDYVAFIDSDDILHPQFFEYLAANIGEADYIFCLFKKFEDGTNPEMQIDDSKFEIQEISRKEMLTNLNTFHYPHSIIACNKLYKAHIWSNLRFPNGKIHEDAWNQWMTFDGKGLIASLRDGRPLVESESYPEIFKCFQDLHDELNMFPPMPMHL